MAKDYPKIKSVSFEPLGVLQNVFNYFITKEINNDYSFQFDMLLDDPKVSLIQDQNYVEIKGQLYTINLYTIRRTQSNEKFLHVEGAHIFYNLINEYREKDGELDNYKPNALQEDIMDELVINTPYSIISSEITKRNDIMLERGNILKNIVKSITTFGGEMQLNNFTFSVLNKLGNNTGAQVRYKKNMKEIVKTVDARAVVTRLFVYGKDGLTIESVNGGKKYLDSQYKDKYSYLRKGEIVYNDIEDPIKLLELGNELLIKNELPSISYQVPLLILKNNKIEYGDTVNVIDDELGIKLQSRALKYVEYLLPEESHLSSITLGNFITTMMDFYKKYEQSSQIVSKAFDRQTNNLNTNFLEGRINTLKNQLLASGAYATAQVLDNQGFLLENTNASSLDYGAMYLGPGIFAIADGKLGGTWNWRTFGTGKGFVADEIVTGTLRSLNIDNGNGNFTVDEDGNMFANSGVFKGKIQTYNGVNSLTIDPASGSILSVVNEITGNEMVRIDGAGNLKARDFGFINSTVASINNTFGYLIFKDANGNRIEFGAGLSDDDISITTRLNPNLNANVDVDTLYGSFRYNGSEVATVNYAVKDNLGQGIRLQYYNGHLEFYDPQLMDMVQLANT